MVKVRFVQLRTCGSILVGLGSAPCLLRLCAAVRFAEGKGKQMFCYQNKMISIGVHSQVEVEMFACGCALACILHLELPLSARALISAALIHFLCLITLPVFSLVLFHSFSPSTHFSTVLPVHPSHAIDGLIVFLKWLLCVVWKKEELRNKWKMKSVLRPSCDDPRSIASGMIRRRRVGLIELHNFFFSNHHDRYILQHVRSLSAPLSLVQPAIWVKNHLHTKSMLEGGGGNDQQFCVCAYVRVCVHVFKRIVYRWSTAVSISTGMAFCRCAVSDVLVLNESLSTQLILSLFLKFIDSSAQSLPLTS